MVSFISGFVSGVVVTSLAVWWLLWLLAHPEDYDSPTGYYKEGK